MNGRNINTKNTVTVFNLLVVEEMCINAIGAKLGAVLWFSSKDLLSQPGEEPASPEIPPLRPYVATWSDYIQSDEQKPFEERWEPATSCGHSNILYGAHDQCLCDCALNEAWSWVL